MTPKTVTSISEPIAAPIELQAVIRRHRDFVELFRLMKSRLGLTNEFIDAAGGLTPGHCDKLLGPSLSRNFGAAIFDTFCTLFALEFHVHLDFEAMQRMRPIWEGRKRPLLPNGKGARVSKELLERARPHVLRANAKAANAARNEMLSREQRSAIARRAARVRWAKHRRRPTVCVAPSTG